jgi:cation diffusion facilitator family transporter
MSIENKKTDDKARLNMSYLTFIAGVVLLIIKFYAYSQTHSKAILSDAFESIVNVISAIVLIIVIKIASKPADKDHPYGHGKVEHLASSLEGGAILFAGILICIDSVEAILKSSQITNLDSGLFLIIISGVVNGVLGIALKLKGKKLQSSAMQASGAHLITDLITTVGVVVGILLVKWTGIHLFDPLVAILIGLHLIWAGSKILRSSTSELLDAEDESLLKILLKNFNIHRKMNGIIDIHFTRIMRSGRYHHIDLHLVVPEFWSVAKTHDLSDAFEQRLLEDYPFEAEIHFHFDPCRKLHCGICDLENCDIRQAPFVSAAERSLKDITAPEPLKP